MHSPAEARHERLLNGEHELSAAEQAQLGMWTPGADDEPPPFRYTDADIERFRAIEPDCGD